MKADHKHGVSRFGMTADNLFGSGIVELGDFKQIFAKFTAVMDRDFNQAWGLCGLGLVVFPELLNRLDKACAIGANGVK